jgi:hypothetical protein
VPVFAGIGGALALAQSASADEIVLNSIAIAFIFDLDELVYKIVPKRARDVYEKHPSLAVPLPEPPVEQATVGAFELPAQRWLHAQDKVLTPASRIVVVYSFLIYFVDVILMFATYSIPTGIYFAGLPFSAGLQFVYAMDFHGNEENIFGEPPTKVYQFNPANDYAQMYNEGMILISFWARTSILSLGHVHFMVWRYASSTRKSDLSRAAQRAALCARILVCVGFNILGCYT